MTAYNREKYIADAIQSILNSTYKNFELIIVDDCSTDNTSNIIKAFELNDNRVKVYSNDKNLGDYKNRNKAASYAKGKYIKYLDSDDIIYPFSLEYMVGCMEQYPTAAFGFCYRQTQINSQPFPKQYSPVQAYKEHFLENGFFYAGPGSCIIRRDYFDDIGQFSGKRYVGDFELWLSLSKKNNCIVFQSGLIWWRTHEGQEFELGQKKGNYLLANFKCIKEALFNAQCPLDPKDIQKAFHIQKVLFCRNVLSLFITNNNIAYKIYKQSNLNIFDCFISVFPLRFSKYYYEK